MVNIFRKMWSKKQIHKEIHQESSKLYRHVIATSGSEIVQIISPDNTPITMTNIGSFIKNGNIVNVSYGHPNALEYATGISLYNDETLYILVRQYQGSTPLAEITNAITTLGTDTVTKL